MLPGRARNSIRVLIPDDRAASPRFHDVMLVDQTSESGPIVSMVDMCNLRRQWPKTLLSGMSRRQTELETMRRKCKAKFRNKQAGLCRECGKNIQHGMARHVSTYHLDLGQLWRCPVSWCTHWKGTPQDCIDHIHARHHVDSELREVAPERRGTRNYRRMCRACQLM